MASKLEVAEAMYQAARVAATAKTPETLEELAPHAQERYLMLAGAAIEAIGTPAPAGFQQRELLDDLAVELAWKLRHPQQFADGVREVLERYAVAVGPGDVPEEVREAMKI